MKKSALLLASLSILVSLCACGSSGGSEDKSNIVKETSSITVSKQESLSESPLEGNQEISELTKSEDTTETDSSNEPSEKIMAPSDEYVLERLRLVDTITEAEAVTEDHDPNGNLGKQGGYIGCVYFRDSQVDWSKLYIEDGKDNVIDVGTQGGGCLEIYANTKDAEKRDAYLAGFDGTAFSSGSHLIVGTVLIRTSNELKASQQKALTEKISNALVSNKTGSK